MKNRIFHHEKIKKAKNTQMVKSAELPEGLLGHKESVGQEKMSSLLATRVQRTGAN